MHLLPTKAAPAAQPQLPESIMRRLAAHDREVAKRGLRR